MKEMEDMLDVLTFNLAYLNSLFSGKKSDLIQQRIEMYSKSSSPDRVNLIFARKTLLFLC